MKNLSTQVLNLDKQFHAVFHIIKKQTPNMQLIHDPSTDTLRENYVRQILKKFYRKPTEKLYKYINDNMF